MQSSPDKYQVLLIEDDLIDQEYFRRIIKRTAQVEVVNADCLQDGIELLRERSFDAVLFDLGLPDSFGIDTVKRMTEEFGSLPLIVLTGSVDKQTAEEASQFGVYGYLVKGEATSTEIIDTVHSAVESPRLDHATNLAD